MFSLKAVSCTNRDFMDRKLILLENNSTPCALKIYRERNMPPIIERSLIPGSDYIGSIQDLKDQENNQYYVLKVWSADIFLKNPDLDIGTKYQTLRLHFYNQSVVYIQFNILLLMQKLRYRKIDRNRSEYHRSCDQADRLPSLCVLLFMQFHLVNPNRSLMTKQSKHVFIRAALLVSGSFSFPQSACKGWARPLCYPSIVICFPISLLGTHLTLTARKGIQLSISRLLTIWGKHTTELGT